MNSCQKVIRSVRNIILQLCTNCEKQFDTNAQKCEKTSHGYHETMISHQLRVREFLTYNKTVIMAQPPYSTGLAFAHFFLFPKLKTAMKGKRFATIEEREREKKLLALLKSTFRKCFEDWKKKTLALVYYI